MVRDRERERLDPLRWRPPGRGTLVRVVVVAALLVTAVATLYARDPAPPRAGDAAPPATAAAPSAPSPSAARGGSSAARGGRPVVPAGTVGVPVRLAEAAALAVVRPGDRVDLLAARPTGGAAVTVAAGVLVLGVIGGGAADTGGAGDAGRPVRPPDHRGVPDGGGGPHGGGVADGDSAAHTDVWPSEVSSGSPALFLALTRRQAEKTVGAPEGTRFAVVVRP